MRRSGFSEQRVVDVLQEYDAGAKVSELYRKHGISATTLYKCKKRYGGLGVAELRRLEELERENAELKRRLANAKVDKAALKNLLARNF